jgi:hypothetical protein
VSDVPIAEDYASIDRAEEAVQAGWKRRFSLSEVIDMWFTFVTVVERGYRLTIDDYTNDLSIRRWPEQARKHLTTQAERWMDARLSPLDEAFRAATHPISERLPGAGTEWWWETRLPNLLVDELREDVERMGLR